VINPSDSFDYRYIKALMEASPGAVEVAKKPQFTFTEKERDDVTSSKAPVVTRPVIVNFQTGSAQLTKRAQRIIDQEMVPLVESHGSAYFEVSGNTDSTGAATVNMRLSRQRAESVVRYLVAQWEFPAERFKVVGNGPNKPLCNEHKPDEGLDLPQCRARNRATRLAIIARQ
jgi:outer membrane protein OmpA-like peptidoglycan-associated protein